MQEGEQEEWICFFNIHNKKTIVNGFTKKFQGGMCNEHKCSKSND